MGNFALKPGFGKVPDSLKNPRISKLNLKSGQVSELPVNHSAQLDPGEQAVILFQPFPNNSHQRKLEGDHRASKAVGKWGLGGAAWSQSTQHLLEIASSYNRLVPFTGFGGQRGACRRPQGAQPSLSS